MEYHHGIYVLEDYENSTWKGVPLVREYLQLKLLKFKAKWNIDFLEYTIGYDSLGGITIAICEPHDPFYPEIGKQIVIGRLQRLNGILKNKNGTIRKPYCPIPPYIFPRLEKRDAVKVTEL